MVGFVEQRHVATEWRIMPTGALSSQGRVIRHFVTGRLTTGRLQRSLNYRPGLQLASTACTDRIGAININDLVSTSPGKNS